MRLFRRTAGRGPDCGTFPLVVVDAGARAGLAGFAALRSRIELHAFEPDREAADALAQQAGWRAMRVEPVALAAAAGEVVLHVARHGALSSLLEPDLDAYDALFGHMATHAAWRRGLETVARRRVPATTLDVWAAAHGVSAIHFLKLDTQGSELDVLRGGDGLVARGGVHVVQVEVALQPFYRGQPRFSEVDAWLTGRGFALVDCRFAPEAAGPVRPDAGGVWGEGPRWTASADATYVRTPRAGAQRAHVDVEAVLASALILAQLGYGSTAAAWLSRHARWSAGDVDGFLLAWGRPTAAERRRLHLREWMPPVLLDAWRQRRAAETP
jgi:FkbM family methyltransferase